MQYLITFLEGIISFVSPCMLPMLPIYISYFAGGADKKQNTLMRAIFFVLGFTLVFALLGLFAGTLGSFFTKYETALHIVCGVIIILLGLNFLDIIHIPMFHAKSSSQKVTGVFSAFLFGVVFSISHTPCVGAFLGSALAMAAHSGTALAGIMLLVVYSLGMGIPFVLSAVLIDKLAKVFDAIKRNYRIINIVCGIFLIVLGVAMMTGVMHHLMGVH